MFLFQFHEDSLRQLKEERRRDERHAQLLVELRALRGAVPPFDGGATRRLTAAMAEPRYAGPERRLVPCPEMKEATTP
jgi:hypothetical protein